jgi:hypothetical protein
MTLLDQVHWSAVGEARAVFAFINFMNNALTKIDASYFAALD